jgi:hypothetical protein
MGKLRKLFSGGSAANEQLTAVVAMLLLALLAVEGATLLNVRSLLTVHAFVGILLIPVIAMKLASTSWRMLRYYRGVEEYVLRGPPHIVLRMIVAPILIGSTITLFGTGVWLLAVDQTEGTLVGLHKASFVVWAGAFGLHLLSRALPALRAVRRRAPGFTLRLGLASLSLVAGLALATATLPAVDHLQDNVSGQVGLDSD